MAIDQTPTPTHEPDLSAIHQEALISFDQMYEVCWDERRQSIEDRRFGTVAGAMWEDQFGEQFTNRPKLEINKVHLAVIGLINEYRANRVSVDFLPMPGVSDDNLADTCDGLYRAAETTGVGMEAYDNAFEEAVSGGFGAYRLRAVYEDEYDATNDHQKIIIEPIYDADSSVFFDLDAKRQDKSDATKCWVLTAMTHERYRLEYNSDPATWHADLNDWTFDWATPDLVYVAEYYRVETSRHKVQTFRMLNGDIERY